jgi:hypothetical protein
MQRDERRGILLTHLTDQQIGNHPYAPRLLTTMITRQSDLYRPGSIVTTILCVALSGTLGTMPSNRGDPRAIPAATLGEVNRPVAR